MLLMGGALLNLPIRNSYQRLSLFSKGLLLGRDSALARNGGNCLAGCKGHPSEVFVVFGRAIAASSYGEVLHFNLGMEDQWG